MFDRNSDYALNKKDPDAIVCKSATGIHIRLTRADFSSAEEFEKWKRWSDENYHAIEKADHRHSNRTISLEGLLNYPLRCSLPKRRSWINTTKRNGPAYAACWPRAWMPA